MTPALMVLLFVTNDFLSMSLTTDRASPAPSPSVWRMRNITAAAVVLGACKLAFSTAMLAFGKFQLGLGRRNCRRWRSSRSCSETRPCCTCCGNGARCGAPGRAIGCWRRRPSDIAFVATLALSGILMAPLPWRIVAAVFVRGGRVRADPRSDQAAGPAGIQGRVKCRITLEEYAALLLGFASGLGGRERHETGADRGQPTQHGIAGTQEPRG